MNSITIRHYPNTSYTLIPCLSPITVDINQAVKKKLDGKVLERDIVLPILKEVKKQSDCKVWLAKIVFWLTPLILIQSARLLILSSVAACVLLAQMLAMLAGVFITLILADLVLDYFTSISCLRGYVQQSEQLRKYIYVLENDASDLQILLEK